MPKLNIDLTTKMKLLITGNPGIGKTTLLGTGMDDERTTPVLDLNFAGNPQVFVARPPDKRPTVWNCKSLTEVSHILSWIRQGQPASRMREEMELPNGVNFQTLCIDHLAEFQRLQYADIMGSVGAAEDIHGGKIAEFKHWNLMWQRSVALARVLSDPTWPTHVVMTVHIKTGEDGIGRTYEPMLYGQSDFEVPGYVLAHGWLTWVSDMPKEVRAQAGGAERVLVFKELFRHVNLKEQYAGRIPTYVFEPTIPMLVDMIEGKRVED